MTAAGTAEAAPGGIDARFPGWHAWVSDAGHWYAVRLGASWQRTDPRPVTVDADTADGLRDLLAGVAGWVLPETF